ncbi:hypothetical protein AB4Z09_27035 [Rhodococcus sp. TAF43]|uniref:hypothetical protein n=1 Tax=Rhodococcus sp. TAF43 TaxID=3237483 RepID=UPI003F960F41
MIAWADADRGRLTVMARLRVHGFSEATPAEPAPDYRTLTQLASEIWSATFDDWAALHPWRIAPPWWQLAVRAPR